MISWVQLSFKFLCFVKFSTQYLTSSRFFYSDMTRCRNAVSKTKESYKNWLKIWHVETLCFETWCVVKKTDSKNESSGIFFSKITFLTNFYSSEIFFSILRKARKCKVYVFTGWNDQKKIFLKAKFPTIFGPLKTISLQNFLLCERCDSKSDG